MISLDHCSEAFKYTSTFYLLTYFAYTVQSPCCQMHWWSNDRQTPG